MAVTAKWERPDGRRQLSVTAPLFIECDGVRTRVRDWSLSGFTVDADAGTWPNGLERSVKVTLPFQGFEVSFDAPIRVVESNPCEGFFAADYVSLGSRERELLRHFLDELVRGSMTDVRDTIHRIDVPVAPLSTMPEPSTADAAHSASGSPIARRLSPRVMMGAYAALGALVFGYLGYLTFSTLFRFEVETAVLSTPADSIAAQGDGFVTLASFRPGDAVKQGDVLVNLFDNQLEREIELSEITVREREARFTHLQKRALEELARLQSAVDGPGQGGAKIKLEVESLRARVQATEQEVRRVSTRPRDLQATARIEEAKKKLLANQKALEGKQVELRSRLERDLLSPGNRNAASGQLALQQMTALEAQMAQAEQDYEFAQLRHQSIVAHRTRLAVRAPYDGILTSLPRTDRAVVRKGDLLAVVEQRGVPEVTALVSQSDAMRVGLGDAARLYIPALGAYFPARVARIDRSTETHRDQNRAPGTAYNGHSAADAPVKVALSLDRPELVQNRQQYANGLPVVVQFQRRWTTTAQTITRGASTGLATAREVIGPSASRAAPAP